MDNNSMWLESYVNNYQWIGSNKDPPNKNYSIVQIIINTFSDLVSINRKLINISKCWEPFFFFFLTYNI